MNQGSIDDKRREFIKEIENRLQFVITISIFFFGLISYISKSINVNVNEVNLAIVPFIIIIALYLLDYFCFEIGGLKIVKERVFLWINRLVLFGIFIYIIPLIVFAMGNMNISPDLLAIIKVLFNSSLYGLIIIPFFVLSLILFSGKIKKSNK